MILSVDPGKSGGWALFYERTPKTGNKGGAVHSAGPWNRYGLEETVSGFRHQQEFISKMVIEEVGASPQMGTTSAFSFGRNFGEWLGFSLSLPNLIEQTHVRPQIWEFWTKKNHYKGSPEYWKTKHKAALKETAEQCYPYLKITYAIADAVLLGKWYLETKGVYGK
jgi:hypothetical protein